MGVPKVATVAERIPPTMAPKGNLPMAIERVVLVEQILVKVTMKLYAPHDWHPPILGTSHSMQTEHVMPYAPAMHTVSTPTQFTTTSY